MICNGYTVSLRQAHLLAEELHRSVHQRFLRSDERTIKSALIREGFF